MKVGVLGMGHLGQVTAACLGHVGHAVHTFGQRKAIPFEEPGLSGMLESPPGIAHLDLRDSEVLWVTYDTPVSTDDRADVDFVVGEVKSFAVSLPEGATVLISSQVPVGTTRALSEWSQAQGLKFSWAYSPENLRRGKAVNDFLYPTRVVVGTGDVAVVRERIEKLFTPIDNRYVERGQKPFGTIEWMTLESAEMSKHAINAFFAASIALSNEIGDLCAKTGVDPKQVERALRSEPRIGKGAYVRAGEPYTGGTLGRDIRYLINLGGKYGLPMDVAAAIHTSNTRRLPVRDLGDELTRSQQFPYASKCAATGQHVFLPGHLGHGCNRCGKPYAGELL